MLDQQKEAFREEAAELLAELETSLLELEENPQEEELIAQVFRAMHTIKGSGAMFGFEAIAAFTHEVETVFDLVRNGEVRVTKNLVDLSLAARDHIKGLLDDPESETCGQQLIEEFRKLIPGSGTGTVAEASSSLDDKQADEERAPEMTYRIRFRPAKDIILSGTRPTALLIELAELGPCRIVAQTEDIPFLNELEPECCYTVWDVILTTNLGVNAIKDVFIFVEDEVELSIDSIDNGSAENAEEEYKRLGEILVERGELTPEDLKAVLDTQKRLGEVLVESELVTPGQIASALAEQQQVRQQRQERRQRQQKTGDDGPTSIRVPADRLDYLVDMVGELVTVQARLSQAAGIRQDSELTSIAEEVERLTAELRDSSLNMRMLPIGTTFSKFKRLVRDLSLELGKEIELKTAGAETELDKTVIEKLSDPLVHLIRNSLDHGIEPPEEREAVGKPSLGTVELVAIHSGDSVIIEIRDDGRGLDREALFAKAVEKGLIGADTQLGEAETYGLIFAPGFSTAKTVTDVSGRGVGMDVVKRSIDALRGTISIRSEQGKGTTISIRIPLTLAIIESLLVKIGEDCFVLPLSAVEECVELTREDVEKAHGRNLVPVRGQLIPYIPLREQFAMEGKSPVIEQVVVTNVGGNRVGFVVDHVIGEHQTVIKSLGRMYRDVEGISGATILGDGTVALILDLPQIVHHSESNEIQAVRA